MLACCKYTTRIALSIFWGLCHYVSTLEPRTEIHSVRRKDSKAKAGWQAGSLGSRQAATEEARQPAEEKKGNFHQPEARSRLHLCAPNQKIQPSKLKRPRRMHRRRGVLTGSCITERIRFALVSLSLPQHYTTLPTDSHHVFQSSCHHCHICHEPSKLYYHSCRQQKGVRIGSCWRHWTTLEFVVEIVAGSF